MKTDGGCPTGQDRHRRGREADERPALAAIDQFLPEAEVAGVCADGNGAVNLCLETRPDLVVLDVRLPEVSGLEILHILKQRMPELKVVLYSGNVGLEGVRIALRAGADSYVSKAAGLGEFVRAIKTVLAGGRHFDEGLLARLGDV